MVEILGGLILEINMRTFLCLMASSLLIGLGACSTAPESEEGKATLDSKSMDALGTFKRTDPSLQSFLDRAYGYAIFPTVGKGAVGVGGAYGRGEVFERGVLIGYCDLSQGTVGVQLGGQSYSELLVFENKNALDKFTSGEFAFDAQASAVALKSGASANAKFSNGVAVFTMTKEGLMFEASIGGQKFSYQRK
jgi:lipid-binding SYLF domain-containing protein